VLGAASGMLDHARIHPDHQPCLSEGVGRSSFSGFLVVLHLPQMVRPVRRTEQTHSPIPGRQPIGLFVGDPMTNIPFNRPFIVGKELYYIAQACAGRSPRRRWRVQQEMPDVAGAEVWSEESAVDPTRAPRLSKWPPILCDFEPGDEKVISCRRTRSYRQPTRLPSAGAGSLC